MCLQELLEAERNRIVNTLIAENQFKKSLINDWIAAAGKSGNTVNGKWGIDPKYNSTNNNIYRGPTNKLLFDTLGMDFGQMDSLWSNSAVEKLWFGLKTDWIRERNDNGYLVNGWTGLIQNGSTYNVASINGDESTFKAVLNSINNTYGDITGINVICSRTGKGVHEDEATAIAMAKSNSLPSTSNSKVGINSTVPATGINTGEGQLIIDSITISNFLDGTIVLSAPTSYEITTEQITVQENYYNSGGEYWDTRTVLKTSATVITYFIEERTFSLRRFFDTNNYYDLIKANWNTVTTRVKRCSSYNYTSEGPVCSNNNYGDYYEWYENIYGYKGIYSRAVYFLESQVDWLIRSGDHYNIDYIKYNKARAHEVISTLQLALNIWVEEDDGGFWGSNWGAFFRMIIFVVAAIAIVFVIAYGLLIGGFTGGAIGSIGTFFIAYGAAAITREPMMFKFLMAWGAIAGIGIGTIGSNYEQWAIDEVARDSGNAAASASMNNISTGALDSALTIYGLMEVMPSSPVGEYYDDMDAEDKQRAALFMDDSCGDTMYYNYDTQPPFTDDNFSYDTMS